MSLIGRGVGLSIFWVYVSVAVGSAPGIFSARTHVNKYGKDERNDVRPYAKLIGCPLLVIVGSAVIRQVTPLPGVAGVFQWHLADVERAPDLRRPDRHPQPSWFEVG